MGNQSSLGTVNHWNSKSFISLKIQGKLEYKIFNVSVQMFSSATDWTLLKTVKLRNKIT